MKNRALVILLFLTTLCSAAAFEVNDLQLHLKITGITAAAPPEMWRDYLILTYKPDKPARYVGAAFELDDYTTIHTYMVNSEGIYFLIMPLPDRETLSYRLVVDGIWTTDPANPQTVRDRNGLKLSQLTFPPGRQTGKLSPVLMENNMVEFHIRTSPGKRIYLAGDFNRWDPYMTTLKEKEPGEYSAVLSLKPGRYGYYYLIDGEPVTDPLNFQKTTTSAGEYVSILYIPG